MITKADTKTFSGVYTSARTAKLSTLEKSMLRWVTVDQKDKVLDASVGNGLVAEYLRRNMICEVCGFSSNMADVREARGRLQNCDIMYAGQGDIPWHENSFDTVLMKADSENQDGLRQTLKEVYRVLKSGGQFVLGVNHCSKLLNLLASVFSEEQNERQQFSKDYFLHIMNEIGFESLLWQRTGLTESVVIGWKKNEERDLE